MMSKKSVSVNVMVMSGAIIEVVNVPPVNSFNRVGEGVPSSWIMSFVGSKVENLTVSSNVIERVPASRSKVKLSNLGEVVSSIYSSNITAATGSDTLPPVVVKMSLPATSLKAPPIKRKYELDLSVPI